LKGAGLTARKDEAMSLEQIREMLSREATVPLWPDAGKALGLKRNHAYLAANRGEIEVMQFGHLKRVSTAWLRKKLGLEA
jgi:hypothetical protein